MNITKQILTVEQLLKEQRYDQAEVICNKILKVIPSNIKAALLLGSIHLTRLNYGESRRILENLLNLEPDHLDANNDLGVLYLHLKDLKSAEKYFRKVIAMDPYHIHALINLGNIHFNFEQWASAESLYKKVLKLDPVNRIVLNNYGQLLLKQNRMAEGIDLMKQVDSLSNPGVSVLVAYLIAKHICQWDVAERLLIAVIDIIMDSGSCEHYLSMLGLTMLSDPYIDNETFFKITCLTAEIFDKLSFGKSNRDYTKAIRSLQTGHKMRIGYLSADFRQHVCSNFVRGLINCYDKERFEVYCYSNTSEEDEITLQYKSNVEAFIDTRGMSDRELSERIYEDDVHILVDLSGYTDGSRISVMSYCAAPVQITYMGYPFSTGFRSIDYIISDPHTDSPTSSKLCTETPLRLPEAGAAFGSLFPEEINHVPAFQRNGHVTFGSLLNTYKLNPKVVEMWSLILKQTNDTRMILNHPNYAPEIIRQNILKEFAKHGISEKQILFIWERLTNATHLYYYNDIDIALDSLPMTGGQTTIDALWMGVPVVTCVGESRHERSSYDMLKIIGIDVEDIIAFSEEEYVQKTIALANNPERLAELHQIIPEGLSKSIFCDPERFAIHLEAAYIEAWNMKFPQNRFDPGERRDPLDFISIRGGTEIAVSGSVGDRFTYILKEQEGWFDPEYDFVLDMIQPDMRVIDIVAEVGVYAVPLAKKMTAGGKVWALSTDASHARYLHKSKEHNHLDSLQVLGNRRIGNLNLDRDMLRNDWSHIDFVRINTDGAEQGLIRWGTTFFSLSSPLVMFGIKDKGIRALSLVDLFKEQGYATYRLIPGLNLLTPFDSANEHDELDDFSINLFCCKKDRAEQLENRGLLMSSHLPAATTIDCDASAFRHYLTGLPYAEGMMTHWLNTSTRPEGWESYQQALSLFSMAKTANHAASFRYACLQGAFHLLKKLLSDQANVSRVMSMIRLLTDMGKRVLAVEVLNHLAEFLETGKGGIVMNIDEPFLALSDSFAALNPGDKIAEWIYASILEQREKLRAFSSFYTGKESFEILGKIIEFDFSSDEMKRRRQLIGMRYKVDSTSTAPL